MVCFMFISCVFCLVFFSALVASPFRVLLMLWVCTSAFQRVSSPCKLYIVCFHLRYHYAIGLTWIPDNFDLYCQDITRMHYYLVVPEKICPLRLTRNYLNLMKMFPLIYNVYLVFTIEGIYTVTSFETT